MKKNSAFTIIELLVAMAIASVIGLGTITAILLITKGADETSREVTAQQEFDLITERIYNLLVNTDRSAIDQILATDSSPSAVGYGIVFQVPTPNASGEYETNGVLHWGDGVTENNYIRIQQNANNDVVMEILDSSKNVVSSQLLSKNCTFQIQGSFINNSGNLEYNNSSPAIIDVKLEKQNKNFNLPPYRRHFQITLRVH